METWCVKIYRANWASRKSIATSTSAGSAMLPRKLRKMAAFPGALRLPPMKPPQRKAVARLSEPFGAFILVHAATSIDVCEQRDRKGLYAKARAGIVKEFTGISDPYEAPTNAEVVIDTAKLSPEEAAQTIILHLEREGFVGANGNG